MNGNEAARILVNLAGIQIQPEREAVFAGALAGTKRIAESLSKVDLAGAEPAAQFRAPKPE